jgi:hypothetical protein
MAPVHEPGTRAGGDLRIGLGHGNNAERGLKPRRSNPHYEAHRLDANSGGMHAQPK